MDVFLIIFLKWAIPGLFFFIFVFSIQLTVNKCSINFADDWIRTANLWYRKRPLYQLSHTTTAQLLHRANKMFHLLPNYKAKEPSTKVGEGKEP